MIRDWDMSKRKRYTDEFRASAVLMLEAAGYPDKEGALVKVARHLKMPHSTLSRWARSKNNPPPSELVQNKKIDLVASIKEEISHVFDEFGKTRQDAEYKELATAFGIFVDKLQLLEGKPTSITENTIKDDRDRILANLAEKSGGYVTRDASEVVKRPVA